VRRIAASKRQAAEWEERHDLPDAAQAARGGDRAVVTVLLVNPAAGEGAASTALGALLVAGRTGY
jgi:hypothetical protein